LLLKFYNFFVYRLIGHFQFTDSKFNFSKIYVSILYNMSADAYAKLVAHNNTVVQQFKTYKESQERALAEAYSRLAALKEFCAKEREEMREAFEQEKQAMRDEFEREKQEILEREKQEILERENQAGGEVDTNQILNKALSGFFRHV
jgi:predicted membrane protein